MCDSTSKPLIWNYDSMSIVHRLIFSKNTMVLVLKFNTTLILVFKIQYHFVVGFEKSELYDVDFEILALF